MTKKVNTASDSTNNPLKNINNSTVPADTTEKFAEIFSIVKRNKDFNAENPHKLFSIRKTTIEHKAFCGALKKIATLHKRGLDVGDASGVLVTGQTGSGKTTLAEFYVAHFPPVIQEELTTIPVLFVTTPESPTVKGLAEAILVAIGDPLARKGTKEIKTSRIVTFLKKCKVELIIIDEFQHFYDSKLVSQAEKVTDWLKNLFNIVKIPVVLIGLPRSVMVIRKNPQLKRRFSAPYYLKPFEFDTASEQMEFRGVMKHIGTKLPLPSIALHDVNIAKRFFYASCGLFDYVAKIIDRAVLYAGEMNHPSLTLEHLQVAFRDEVWSDVPKTLNPFSPKPILRLLTKISEPFEIWDDPKQYSEKAAGKGK